jgi:hypothetical protein
MSHFLLSFVFPAFAGMTKSVLLNLDSCEWPEGDPPSPGLKRGGFAAT